MSRVQEVQVPRHRLSRYKFGAVRRRAIRSLYDPQSCASKPCGLFCHLGRRTCKDLHYHAALSSKLRSIACTGHRSTLGPLALLLSFSSRRSPRVPGAVVSALRSRHAAGDAWPTRLPATKYCLNCAMCSTARVLGGAECARRRHRHFAMESSRTVTVSTSSCTDPLNASSTAVQCSRRRSTAAIWTGSVTLRHACCSAKTTAQQQQQQQQQKQQQQ